MPELINFCGNFARSYKDVEISEQTEVGIMDGIFKSTFASLALLPLSLMAGAEHLWKWLGGCVCECVHGADIYHTWPTRRLEALGTWRRILFSFLCNGNRMKWCCKWCFMALKSSKNGRGITQQNPSAWHVSLRKCYRNNNRSGSHPIYITVNSK